MQSAHYDSSALATYCVATSEDFMAQSTSGEGQRSRRLNSAIPKAECAEPAGPADASCYDRSKAYRQEPTSLRAPYSYPDFCSSPWARNGGARQIQSLGLHLASSLDRILTGLPDGYYDEPDAAWREVYWHGSDRVPSGKGYSPEVTAAPLLCPPRAVYNHGIVPSQRVGLYGPHGSASNVSDVRGQGGANPGPLSRNQLLAKYSTIADALTPVVDDHLPCHSPGAQTAGLPYSDERESCVPDATVDPCSAGEAMKRKAGPKRHMCTVCHKFFPR